MQKRDWKGWNVTMDRVDKRWERHPDEKECSGGADVEVFRLWEANTRNAGRICVRNICVWWWESGGRVGMKKY